MNTVKKSRIQHLSKQSYDLEERLIAFAVDVLGLTDDLPNTLPGKHISNHLIRSSTSSALHYGEAESAESRKDFIHKMRVSLKELREVLIALKICKLKPLVSDLNQINIIL